MYKMQCPDCKIELEKGPLKKEKDGTEYFELRCPKCKRKFLDLKIPFSAFGSSEELK